MKRLVGDRAFYKLVLALALPLLLQNALSNFVNLLDNLMVGQVGTEQMSGVSIVNQLLFVYNLCIFGGASGAGIFGAQFYGRRDWEGVKYTLRFNLVLCAVFSLLAGAFLLIARDALIGAFLHDSGSSGSLEATLDYGRQYLDVMLWGLLPFAVTGAYSGVLRVSGDVKLPMWAGAAALLVNLVLNWLLIFGKAGFPVLGVRGAAIATVISRYVEAGLIVAFTHARSETHPYVRGLFRSLRIPGELTVDILIRGMPVLVNELFWSLGQTMLTQCYSIRGLDAVAALNINGVVLNLFNIVMFTMGNAVGILMGNLLGAGEFDRARSYCPKLLALSCALCAAVGGILFAAAPQIPELYNTGAEIKAAAAGLMRVCACMLPLNALTNASYFILRSGGKTYLTILFDSVYSWVFFVPAAWLLVHRTALALIPLFALVNSLEALKAAVGLLLVRKGVWVKNIVARRTA